MTEQTRTTLGYAAVLCCADCGSTMVLKDGKFGKFWGCTKYPKCRGVHGAHPDGTPMGRPANQATRDARKQAHAAFDAHWTGRGWNRERAYRWLQKRMRMGRRECHIARFDEAQCARVIELCRSDQ